MFQPARPPLTWSSVAKRRARLKGSLYDVDAVAMSPMRVVAIAIAVSSTVGSSAPAGRLPTSPKRAGESAKNTESIRPRSAVRASSTKCRTSVLLRASLSGSRQDASWWPVLIRNALSRSRRAPVGRVTRPSSRS